MDFKEIEKAEGIRFSWNAWPSSRVEATRVSIPFGAMWTPLQPIPDIPLLSYSPVQCNGCSAVMNLYSRIDYNSKNWTCQFCYQKNKLDGRYSEISEANLPVELFPNNTVVEYMFSDSNDGISVILLLIDLCQPENELNHLKKSILNFISLLPENSIIGLVTFGNYISVHEFHHTNFNKVFLFNHDTVKNTEEVKKFLGISDSDSLNVAANVNMNGMQRNDVERFFVSIEKDEFYITSRIEELKPDPYPVPSGHRPSRATGSALTIATGLLESFDCIKSSKILLFTSGPCTIGPGVVVGTNLSESIRSHHDIITDDTMYYRKSQKFYTDLGQKLVKKNFSVDIFACGVNQIGICEMKRLIEYTGGLLLLTESFEYDQFSQTLRQLLPRDAEGNAKVFIDGQLEVITTREVRVCGGLGSIYNLRKKSSWVSENRVGQGGSCAWKFCTMSDKSSVAVFFEVVNSHSSPIPTGESLFIQFLTTYRNQKGQKILRTCTVAKNWVSNFEKQLLVDAFDQDAAFVLIARIAVFKAENEESFDVFRWLERLMIRLAKKFAEFRKDEPESLTFPKNFCLFPQLVYHLRRSQFLKVFNNSPDETCFYRLIFNRESIHHSILMIQPSLTSYSFDHIPTSVPLDVSSIKVDHILLFDSFFFIVIHHGSTIATWRKAGYQNDPSHQAFKYLLEAPFNDVQVLLTKRLPVPRLVVCDQNKSQARFLLAKLNPSVTHKTNPSAAHASELILTDDISFETFVSGLQKLAVGS